MKVPFYKCMVRVAKRLCFGKIIEMCKILVLVSDGEYFLSS